jgi:uncharacterized membrane protein
MSTPAGRHRSTGVRAASNSRWPGPLAAVPGQLATMPNRLAGWRGLAGTAGPDRQLAGAAVDPDATPWAERAIRTLAAVFVVTWSFRLSGYLTFGPWLAIPVTLLGLTGLLAIVVAWLPAHVLSSRRQHQVDVAVLVAVVVALALWSYFQVYLAPDYGTDEIAFDQYAAQLALHGINPYLHSMADAFPLFHVSPNGYTFLLNGQPVTRLSYPALAFEAYLPLLALGVTTQAAVLVDVAAWAVGAVVLYAVLPRKLAPLAAVVVSLDAFTGYAVGGITDFLYVPLLIGAAAGWDRFAWTRGPAAWRGPVLLGLAMAVKQTPWLIVPFVVAGIVLESRRLHGWRHGVRDGLRYAAIATAAFLLPNLPYVVESPAAWLRGILTPIVAQTVPAGQGLISLSLSLSAGGGSLHDFTNAALVVFVSILACYVTTYPVLKPAAFIIPSIVLFFSARSFGSYLLMLIPAAIAAAATVQRPQQRTACWRQWKWVAFSAVMWCALTVIATLSSPSPLGMAIRSVRTTGQLATVDQLTVTVTNNSARDVRPAFTIEDGESMTAFWRRVHGPAVLSAHRRASYTIQAPSYFAMPSIGSGFQVLAFTHAPPAVSRSDAYVASLWRVVLQPATINQPVAQGHVISIRAEIVNRLDQPVRVANVPVFLGQVIYSEGGTDFSQAVINNSAIGATPVQALTNPQGVATFAVQVPQSQALTTHDPSYFEANLVKPSSGYPYGYSPILAVRFRP